MKTKIFKLLSVVMVLAMVFSMFACTTSALEGDPVVAYQGIDFVARGITGADGKHTGDVRTNRIASETFVAIADVESISLGEGYVLGIAYYSEPAVAGFKSKVTVNADGAAVNAYAFADAPEGATCFRIEVKEKNNADTDLNALATYGLNIVAKTGGSETPDEPEIVFGQGNVKTAEGKLVLDESQPHRITTTKLLALADYEKIELATGYKAWLYSYKADGTLVNTTGSNAWKEGAYALSNMAFTDAVYFSVTVAKTDNSNLTPADLPADAIVFTKAVPKEEPKPEEPVDDSVTFTPEMVQGNVKTAIGGGLVFNGTVGTRVTSKDLIAIADIEKVEIADGFKAWYYTYTADGILIPNANNEIKGSNAWIEGTYTAEDLQKLSAEGVYFSVTVAYKNDANVTPETLPEGACVITRVIRPEMVQGNVKTAIGGGLVINGTVGTRVTTKELLPIADYKMVKIGAGYKAWYYTYDADGILIPNANNEIKGSNAWVEGNYTAMALMGLSDKGVYFSVTVAKKDDSNLTPDTLPKEAFALVKAPDPVLPTYAIGTVDKGVVMPNVNTRVHTTEFFALADFERVIIADGYKAAYHFYDAEGNWLNSKSWLYTQTMAELKEIADENATQLGLVVALEDNSALSLDKIPADVAKLIVVGAYGACLEHDVKSYTSNNDATCLVDGTKTGTCTICSESVTVKDEFSATGHTYAEGANTCTTCGAERPAADACTHDYRKYTSNGDAKCEIDGTKSATCLLCGTIDTVEDKGSALEHKADYVSDNNATCDKNATQSGVCTLCGKTVSKDIEGSALGHVFGSDDDDYCTRDGCTYTRKRFTYYIAEGRLGGIDTNTGLTLESPLATLEKAITLANEAGYGIGDIITFNVRGQAAWGGTVDGSWENVSEHGFKLILVSDDGTGIVGDGQKNIILGGPVVYDSVLLNANNSWKTFLANGYDVTFNKGFVSDLFDLGLGNRKNLDVNRDVTYTFNAFMSKIWVGNTYHTATYNKTFTLNLNNAPSEDPEEIYRTILVLGAGENGKVVFNGIGTIVNNTANNFEFRDGQKLAIGENGAFYFINNTASKPITLESMKLTAEAAAKTWVLNVASMASINATDVVGTFKVQSGYIATATPATGDAIVSNAGQLVIPAGQYDIGFTICENHVYDDDYDATCNKCNSAREVFIPCEHVWSDYVADGNANCETLGTETRECSECGEIETRDVEGTAPGHIYDNETDEFCNVCDKYINTEPALIKGEDGVWRYYVDGYWDETATTLHKLAGKWFFVEDGIWSKATRLVEYQGKIFYVKGGKWDSTIADTLYKVQGNWYYIVNGKLAVDQTTMVKYKSKWFYVEEGELSLTSRFVNYKGVIFYIKGGKWDKTLNTLIKKDGKYVAVKSGKKYTGKSLITYKGKKFYVNKGYAQLSYSGKVTIGGKKYTIKKGKVV